MAGFHQTEWIAADPATVFNSIIGTGAAEHITENHVSMKKLTDGDVGVGTLYSETRVVNGTTATTELEVIGFESPSYYAVQAEVQGILTVYHYRLSAENEGTRLNLECVITANSFLKRFLIPIVSGIMQKQDGNHLERVKAYVEGLQAADA